MVVMAGRLRTWASTLMSRPDQMKTRPRERQQARNKEEEKHQDEYHAG